MRNLVTFIDAYLETHSRVSIGAVEANALLAQAGLLRDSENRPGLPLRKLLRDGKFPHAYQQGSTWTIPSSGRQPNDSSQPLSFENPYSLTTYSNLSGNQLTNPINNSADSYLPSDIDEDGMDFNSLDSIKRLGFRGFKTVAELMRDKSCLPKVKGIYLVLKTHPALPDFLAIGCGGYFQGRNPNVPVSDLKANWVDDALVLYIGKAGGETAKATLYSRLSQYLRFGQGKNVGHWGGRMIWQLRDSQNLTICWKPLPAEDPRAAEKQLISQFLQKFGKRPFANLTN